MSIQSENNQSHIIGYDGLSIDAFKEMDRLAVERFKLSIELMMENAGMHLARLTSSFIPDKNKKVLIGIGTGNNGGGGLVAARRLAGWGYDVYLDIPDMRLKPLTLIQFERALAYGVSHECIDSPDIFIDAYLGFSQRLPLSLEFKTSIDAANDFSCLKISLDLPTGFNKQDGSSTFIPDIILTLVAMKKELHKLANHTSLYLADIGIPLIAYTEFGIRQPDFSHSGIVKISKNNQ